ncbi:MAG: hypothetical protein ACOYL6_15890 [Bacteriovoracaceae bacterium]
MKLILVGLFALSSFSVLAEDACLFKVNRNERSRTVQKTVVKLLKSKGCKETNIKDLAHINISETDKYESPASYKCFIQVAGSVNNSDFDIRIQTKNLFGTGLCIADKVALEELSYELEKKLDQNL